jgi:hypothetical protein
MLDPLLTQWTCIDGRYGARYRSVLALSESEFTIEHDHVWTKRALSSVLLSDMDERFKREVLRKLAVGCIVVASEHRAITEVDRDSDTEHLTGWERYEEAGIEVVDVRTNTVVSGPLRRCSFDPHVGRIVPPSLDDIMSGRWPDDS